MKVLVTGSAGFVGAHVCNRLANVAKAETIGMDSFNPYYDVRLKRARLEYLTPGMQTFETDIADHSSVCEVFDHVTPDVVIHLAAQAGVRHSFKKPMDYARSNLSGQVSVLEAVRRTKSVKRFIYASSSSVYSGVDQLPFTEEMQLGTPKSLYAATKVADEVVTDTYSKLFGLDSIGLRFFTVYGPWGRPDMAYWSFADSILRGEKINLFNFGDVRRDFTYIDDITEAILNMVTEVRDEVVSAPSHRLYNIGNHSPAPVSEMISILEDALGVEARISLAPLPPGDMVETYADVSKLQNDYGFAPNTPLKIGLIEFVNWFMEWRNGERYSLQFETA